MIWPIMMQPMTHYRIPEMTETLVGKASNCFGSELAYTIFFRKDFARIFQTKWKLKSEEISREKTSREIFRLQFSEWKSGLTVKAAIFSTPAELNRNLMINSCLNLDLLLGTFFVTVKVLRRPVDSTEAVRSCVDHS